MQEENATEVVEVESASPEAEVDAEVQESEAESTPAVEDNDKEKTGSFGERIKELTDRERFGKQAHDAEAFELRQEIDRLNTQLKDRPTTPEPLKMLEDFDFDQPKYDAYKDERTATIAANAAESAVSKVQTQIESGQVEQSFRAREKTFESTVEDYADAVYGPGPYDNGTRKWPATDAMVDELRLSEIGPEMTYHLAKNSKIALEIVSLSPRETVRRMTLLEASLKSEKAKKGKSVSEAPAPVPTIPAGNAGLKKGYEVGMSAAAFKKMRDKEIANR